MISEYAESLAGKLGFDRALSQRVRQEVEDHLRDAVAADGGGDAPAAERRAIANFGDARVIAAQFAVVSLAKQARRTGVAAVLAIAACFVLMKARLAWYAAMQWPGESMGALGAIVVSIDRCAFWLSFFAGIAGWMYIDSRRVPSAFTGEYRGQLRRFSLLCAAAAAALAASVASDGVLTFLRLAGTGWTSGSLLPVFSMATEIACAGVLVSYLRGMARRATPAGRPG